MDPGFCQMHVSSASYLMPDAEGAHTQGDTHTLTHTPVLSTLLVVLLERLWALAHTL